MVTSRRTSRCAVTSARRAQAPVHADRTSSVVGAAPSNKRRPRAWGSHHVGGEGVPAAVRRPRACGSHLVVAQNTKLDRATPPCVGRTLLDQQRRVSLDRNCIGLGAKTHGERVRWGTEVPRPSKAKSLDRTLRIGQRGPRTKSTGRPPARCGIAPVGPRPRRRAEEDTRRRGLRRLR